MKETNRGLIGAIAALLILVGGSLIAIESALADIPVKMTADSGSAKTSR